MHRRRTRKLNRMLISEREISTRVSQMARSISTDYRGRELLALITLRGSFIFAADLLRRLDSRLAVLMDFVTLSSYGDATASSGVVRVVKDPEASLQGADVLIIDDILDTGRTLDCVRGMAEVRGAASVRTATLLLKDKARDFELVPDYVGFRISDVFVVGYGLDHAGHYRNLPDIHVLEAKNPDVSDSYIT